jgi:hypothetical protein
MFANKPQRGEILVEKTPIKKAPAGQKVIVYQMYKFNISPRWGFFERLTSFSTNITSLWDFVKNETE